MKRHRPNASDTISKALIARKLVAGRKNGKGGSAARQGADPRATDATIESRAGLSNGSMPARGASGPGSYAEPLVQPAAPASEMRQITRDSSAPSCFSPARSRHYGLRSPMFKLRSYLFKLRGCQVYDSVPGPRDFIWSCIGSFMAIFILLQLDEMFFTGDQLLLLGSFGASCVIIFGSPHSPFAQPRSVIGGQVLSAAAGALVYTALGEHLALAAPISVTLAFAVMQLTKTMHPPGGATALIAGSGQHIVQQMGIWYPLVPVGAGIVLLFVLGLLINNLSRNRQYPLRWF